MKNPKYIKLLLLLIFHFLLFTFHLKAQWIQQTLPVNKPIQGIEFVDTLKGWACTSRGTPADTGYVLYTTNSGTNWHVQLTTFGIGYTDIDMINSLTGYAAGNDLNISLYRLFSTTNGGLNWSSIIMVPNMTIADIQFLNKDSAWECGPSLGPDVRTTTDGGNTWIVRTSGISGATGRIFFLNYNTGFCAAGFSLYKTVNAGANWSPNGSFSAQVMSIFFLNVNTGWVGTNSDKVYFTSNAGINWQQQSVTPFAGTITDIYFINSQTGWGGNVSTYINKTTNGGLNWGYQRDTSGSYRMSFIDDLHGWTGYYSTGKISHTTDGGGPITYVGIVNINKQIPNNYKLYQNYPNPFNSQTNIKIDILNKVNSGNSNVKLIIYDLLGREIAKLIDEPLKAGSYKVDWDANHNSSGVYFYKLIVEGNIIDTKKMILVK